VTSDIIPSCAQRFFATCQLLCLAVGNAIRPGFITPVLAELVYARICRVRRILLALETRFLAGLPMRGPSRLRVTKEAAHGAPAEMRKAAVTAIRMPRHLAWLCPMVPSEAATYGIRLQAVLAEPGMQALLAACPQAVRVLAPLCRMLGVERSAFVPAGAEPVRVARVRVRKARVVREAFDYAREDAHYAFSGVPRRFRLRVG
jgi:hypothetical protein